MDASEVKVGQVVQDRYCGDVTIMLGPDSSGYLVVRSADGNWHLCTPLDLTPVPARHTFGGVVFEEGEARIPKKGEWYLWNSTEALMAGADHEVHPWPILRPVEIAK